MNKSDEVMECLCDKNATIVFITETWLPSQNNFVTANIKSYGYDFYHNVRQDDRKKWGGGAGILCLKQYKLVKVKSPKFESFDCCICNLINNYHDKVMLIAVYRQQHVSIEIFFEEFTTLLESYCVSDNLLFIGGDVNIHLDVQTDSHTLTFNNILEGFKLHQLVNEPTHKRGHRLDVLITNNCDIVIDTQVIDVGVSDHYLVSCKVQYLPKKLPEFKVIKYRDTKSVDSSRFIEMLQAEFAQRKIFDETSFCSAIDSYNGALKCTLDAVAPIKEKVIKAVPRAPWFDQEYIELRRERRLAEKHFRRTKLTVDWNRYTDLRKQATKLSKRKKVEFYREKVDAAAGSQKALYATVRELSGLKKSPVYPSNQTDKELANSFARFFVEKVNAIRKDLDHKHCNSEASHPLVATATDHPSFDNLSNFSLTCDAEISEIIKTHGLKCGFNDPLPDKLLRKVIDLMIPVWTALVNLSLTTGDFSSVLKHADIIPLLKAVGLDTEALNNFRPVSHLQFIGKMIERVVLRRLDRHLTLNNLDVPNQYGYKKGHGTETILLRIMNDILIASDKKTATILLLLDLSSAFDTVNIEVLINILEVEIGISGTALQWFSSFLRKRTMRVKINDEFSDIFVLEFGIPQGSVLGPILFNIYIRSLYRFIEKAGFNIKGFADDHQLYVSFLPSFQVHYLGDKIRNIFSLITSWMNCFFLKLNPSKSKIIVFGPKRVKQAVTVNGVFIENDSSCLRFSNVVENLGFKLDSALTFSSQINHCVSSSFTSIKLISKLKSFLTHKEKCTLATSLVLSKIDYGNSLYYGINTSFINKLQYVQNSAARLVFNRRKYDHATVLLETLHWLPVKERIIYKINLLIHKCVYNIAPYELCNLLVFDPLRTGKLKSLYKSNSSWGDRAFSTYAPKLWNCLPREMRMETSMDKFKTLLKTYLFTERYL